MSTFRSITPSEATGPEQAAFYWSSAQAGSRTNLAQKLAASPVALKAYLGLGAPLSEGKLNSKQREHRGCDRVYRPVRLLPVRAQHSGLKCQSCRTTGSPRASLTRRKVNYEQNSF